jgi:hypothetical protein
MLCQWDTVDLDPPPLPPKIKKKAGKKNKYLQKKFQVHQTNSMAVSLKIVWDSVAYFRLRDSRKDGARFNPSYAPIKNS